MSKLLSICQEIYLTRRSGKEVVMLYLSGDTFRRIQSDDAARANLTFGAYGDMFIMDVPTRASWTIGQPHDDFLSWRRPLDVESIARQSQWTTGATGMLRLEYI